MIRPILHPSDSSVRIGWESMQEFPAGNDLQECEGSGIIISHGVEIMSQYRGCGYGEAAHRARLAYWIAGGANYALCTVRRDNAVQMHILNKNGWVRLANTAGREGSPIYLMGRNLK